MEQGLLLEFGEVAAESELQDAVLFHQIHARQDYVPQVLEEPAFDTLVVSLEEQRNTPSTIILLMFTITSLLNYHQVYYYTYFNN